MEKTDFKFERKIDIDGKTYEIDNDFFANHRFVITPIIRNFGTYRNSYEFAGEIQSREMDDNTEKMIWVKGDKIYKSTLEELIDKLNNCFKIMAYNQINGG